MENRIYDAINANEIPDFYDDKDKFKRGFVRALIKSAGKENCPESMANEKVESVIDTIDFKDVEYVDGVLTENYKSDWFKLEESSDEYYYLSVQATRGRIEGSAFMVVAEADSGPGLSVRDTNRGYQRE